MLSSLDFHGGPTPTHAPLTGSPAIDAGDPNFTSPPDFDQRGQDFTRVFDIPGVNNGGIIDIGAVELQPSTTSPPTIKQVIISNSDPLAAHAPYNFATATVADLGTGILEPVVGSGNQLRTVPVGEANTVEIVFDKPIDDSNGLLENSLIVAGLTTFDANGITELVPVLGSFVYTSQTKTAKWTFESWDVADFYRISLDDAVTDLGGQALDGEWSNPTSIFTENVAVSEFPSGNGTEGGDFHFVVTILPGDATLDGQVNDTDFNVFLASYMAGIVDALFTEGDFDGNGIVDAADFVIMDGLNWALNFQFVSVLGDLNGNLIVGNDDLFNILENLGILNPTLEDGDLNEDGVINTVDLDLALEQFQLGIVWVF